MGSKRTANIKPVRKAEKKFETQMAKYEKYQFKNLQDMPKLDLSKYDIDVGKYDLDLSKYGPLDASKYDLDLEKYKQENLMEDMPGMEAYTAAADYAGEQFQQSQANIMQAYSGAAGASGAAALAQQASGQAAQFARGQQVGLGEKAAEARKLSLQEQARIQGEERQLMLQQDVAKRDFTISEDQRQRELMYSQDVRGRDLQLQQDFTRRDLMLGEDRTRRDFGYGKMTTMLGVRGEQLSGARQVYSSQLGADSQRSAGMWGAVGSVAAAKIMMPCVPKGTNIDCVDSTVAIESIKPGDIVIGYNGNPVKVLQKHEYLEDPKPKRFYKVKFDNGSIVDVCDMHKIKGEKAMDITENVISKDVYGGVEFSYDLLTEDAGYRIDGIPVNSMIEELAELIVKLKNK